MDNRCSRIIKNTFIVGGEEEHDLEEEEDHQLPLLNDNKNNNNNNNNKKKEGGFRTLPFIIANEALEKMATFGLSPNMSLYLMNQYHMEMTNASSLLFLWSAATNIMTPIGAIIADSFIGRFYTIGVGSISCLVGMILIWSTTVIPQATPEPCTESNATCSSKTTIAQYVYLCAAFGLISIGAGGIRACSLAFGANQLEKEEFQKNPAVKESYFGWYYASYTFAVLIALTCVVYIQDTMGWGVGFAVPAVLMLFASVSFFLASPFYVKLKSRSSLVTGFAQVVVASYKNRHLKLSDSIDFVYHCKNGSALVFPSRKLRFLNKACIMKDAQRELDLNGEATDPWRLCTVDQVEELKALIRVVPIWSSGVIMNICACQNSFPVLQAASMNRYITSSFTIPAASFGTFSVVTVIIWIVLYDRVFLPLASRIMGRQVYSSARSRMGIGIFVSFLAMMVTAVVESIRRNIAINAEYLANSQPAMSSMWLIPQYCLIGISEAANAIAQNEFYFSEFPRSMSSIASTLMGTGMFLANLLASFILNTVDAVSKSGGNESWVSTDINKGHYDYYYLILAGLSVANMMYYLVCSGAYGPSKEERVKADQRDEF